MSEEHTIERRPARFSGGLSLAVAVGTVVVAGASAPVAFVPAVAALGPLAYGVERGSQAAVDGAGALLVVAALLAGYAGAPLTPLLLTFAGGVLAWDLGGNAVEVGEQLGRAAPTRDAEAVHAATSVAVAAVAVLAGVSLSLLTAPGSPTALVLMLVAVLLLATVARS